MYLHPLDQFVKKELRIPYYLRYADDFLILHHDPVALVSLLPALRLFLSDQLALRLHPRKISLRKAQQGIDFLGYVVFPRHILLRTNTKRRMLRRLRHDAHLQRVSSYLGLLRHCASLRLQSVVRQRTVRI